MPFGDGRRNLLPPAQLVPNLVVSANHPGRRSHRFAKASCPTPPVPAASHREPVSQDSTPPQKPLPRAVPAHRSPAQPSLLWGMGEWGGAVCSQPAEPGHRCENLFLRPRSSRNNDPG